MLPQTNFLEILDTLLLPVVNRVFHFLSLPIAGTDDMVQHSTLRRAYFNFILSIAGANLQEVFYSESTLSKQRVLIRRRFFAPIPEDPKLTVQASASLTRAENKDHLQSILQSITHYIANDSLAPDQRYGFGVLNKLLLIWVDQYRPPTAPPLANGTAPPPSPVPGFERFLYEQAVKLCFEVPLKADFDYSDAQSFQVRGWFGNRSPVARKKVLSTDPSRETVSLSRTGHRRDCGSAQSAVAEARERVCRVYDDELLPVHQLPARGKRAVHDCSARSSRVRPPLFLPATLWWRWRTRVKNSRRD